ncbi:hypothetical protein NHX12_032548 [Muraenolepis orangiensis]|uniref:Helicase C-terminal domain-containing protein n=1 Tax=Muraenolepis orangiensis TaxID=630683 RepID=A0A9Q0E9Z1_9TELE|nr:hypothetical protein NHX12_032548 [Muraenolepis orangiensis]
MVTNTTTGHGSTPPPACHLAPHTTEEELCGTDRTWSLGQGLRDWQRTDSGAWGVEELWSGPLSFCPCSPLSLTTRGGWEGKTLSDVEDVKFVINYDYPNSSEDYIHRIGRTARSNNKGTAYTFFTPGNMRQAPELIRVLEEARQTINPKLLQLGGSRGGGGGGGGRSRFRGSSSSSSNNPNLMYHSECERRMRSGSGGVKDSRAASSLGSSLGSSRDADRSSSSSSYRDRSSRDGGRSSGSSSSISSYQSSGAGNGGGGSSGSSQYSSSRATATAVLGSSGAAAGPALPPPLQSGGPRPLMAQHFIPSQPMMGLMGHSPFQFVSPPAAPPVTTRK